MPPSFLNSDLGVKTYAWNSEALVDWKFFTTHLMSRGDDDNLWRHISCHFGSKQLDNFLGIFPIALTLSYIVLPNPRTTI